MSLSRVTDLPPELFLHVRFESPGTQVERQLKRMGRSIDDVAKMETSLKTKLIVNTRLRWHSGKKVCRLPFFLKHGVPIIPGSLISPTTGNKHEEECLIDTGGSFAVSLSGVSAERLQPWLSLEVGSTTARSLFTDNLVFQGILASLHLGNIELTPVQVSASPRNQRDSIVIGRDVLSRFAGMILDWHQGEIIFLPRASDEDRVTQSTEPTSLLDNFVDDPGWISVPWESGNSDIVQHQSSMNGDNTRSIARYTTRDAKRRVAVCIGGRIIRATVDTGLTGDIFSLTDLPEKGSPLNKNYMGFGQLSRIAEYELDCDLSLGPLVFHDVRITRFPDGEKPKPAYLHEELILGMGILQRHPVWFDYERDMLRFWVSHDPLPDFGPPDSPDSSGDAATPGFETRFPIQHSLNLKPRIKKM